MPLIAATPIILRQSYALPACRFAARVYILQHYVTAPPTAAESDCH